MADHGRIFGYARVSTADQNLDAQIVELKEAGATVIYSEKISGVRASRPEFDKLAARLQNGDTLIVTSLDRLGRRQLALLTLMQDFVARGIKFKCLKQDIIDLTSDTISAKILRSILILLAEVEAQFIRERTKAGIERAKARGVKLGRRPVLTRHQVALAKRMMDDNHTLSEIAAVFNVHKSTISRLRAKLDADGKLKRKEKKD